MKTLIWAANALIVIGLTACASQQPETFADRVREEGEDSAVIEQWEEGLEEVKNGEQKIADGKKRLQRGREDLLEGEGLLAEGEEGVRQSRRAYEEAIAARISPESGETVDTESSDLERIAQIWRDAEKKINRGSELVTRGQERVSEGHELIEEGKALLASGREKMEAAEKQYPEMGETAPNSTAVEDDD